jgi:hypothetical protein
MAGLAGRHWKSAANFTVCSPVPYPTLPPDWRRIGNPIFDNEGVVSIPHEHLKAHFIVFLANIYINKTEKWYY